MAYAAIYKPAFITIKQEIPVFRIELVSESASVSLYV